MIEHVWIKTIYVQEFIKNSDDQLYQQLVERLIANILSPMPS